MAAQAWPALNTTIAVTPHGGSLTAIGQVLSISNAGGGEVGERDTTVLSSTVHTSMPTIPDNGEVTFTINYDPTDTGHTTVRNFKDSPPAILPVWVVTFNTSSSNTATFSGWVKNVDGANSEGVDENLTMDVTIRVSGAVTYT